MGTIGALEALQLGQSMLDKVGLSADGWTVQFDHPKFRYSRHASCHYNKREVHVNAFDIYGADDQFFHNAMCHEMAHAVLSSQHGHNDEWLQKAHEFGMTPNWQTKIASAYSKPLHVVRIPRWYAKTEMVKVSSRKFAAPNFSKKAYDVLLPNGKTATFRGVSSHSEDEFKEPMGYFEATDGTMYRTDFTTSFALNVDWKVQTTIPGFPEFVGKKTTDSSYG
jgi:hypothetical protein